MASHREVLKCTQHVDILRSRVAERERRSTEDLDSPCLFKTHLAACGQHVYLMPLAPMTLLRQRSCLRWQRSAARYALPAEPRAKVEWF